MPTVGGLEVSEQELEELRQLFNMVDTDGGGTISEGEVHDLMSMLGMNISALEVRTMVREIDINGKGMVDFEEFVQVVVGQPIAQDELRARAGDTKSMMAFLRHKTYELSTRPVNPDEIGFEYD